MRTFYKAHFLCAEFALSVILTLFLAEAGVWLPALGKALTDLTGKDTTVYSTLASLAGTLLGFVITSISILIAIGRSPQLKLIRDSGQMATVWAVYSQAIGWLAMATVWSLAGMVLSRAGHAGSVIAVGECGLVILCAFRVYRCVWVLSSVVRSTLLPPPHPMNAYAADPAAEV